MIVMSGADLVLPDRVHSAATIVVDDGRIIDIRDGRGSGAEAIDLHGHIILPGMIDVHVHGLEGVDALDGAGAVAAIARCLPKYGVTAFCPTTIACNPQVLRDVLGTIGALRRDPDASAARVLPAHLESNFINPDYCGAQPLQCLRLPSRVHVKEASPAMAGGIDVFDGADIIDAIDRARAEVGIVTLAPELEGAMDLIRHLVSHGTRVSLGHSGATLEQTRAAIAAGARQATHLFNRMRPLNHREPGIAGAVLTTDEIAAEIICDGVHVHADIVRMAVAAKGAHRMMAITDGVAAAGLPAGATAMLGGRPIRAERSAAYLEDGTLAGSVATMDRVFGFLVREVGLSLVDAAQLCAATPARELGLTDLGAIAQGARADLVVMDADLNVRQTYVAGRLVYAKPAA